MKILHKGSEIKSNELNNNLFDNINNCYFLINSEKEGLFSDINLNIYVLNELINKKEEVNIELIQKCLKNINKNFYQIKFFPQQMRIKVLIKMLILIRKIFQNFTKFSIFSLVKLQDKKHSYFLEFMILIINDLSVENISDILQYDEKQEIISLKNQIFKDFKYKDYSINALLTLNKICTFLEFIELDTDLRKKLKEVKFIIDFLCSDDTKFLKILKYGKSFFNLNSSSFDLSNLSKGRIKIQSKENFLKEIFIIINSFDESNITLELYLKEISEENLSYLIYNMYSEKNQINNSSIKEEITSNIYNDLANLCNFYIKFLEDDLTKFDFYYNKEENSNLNSNEYNYFSHQINSRINLLEVCIKIINKKEFPIFKILCDMTLAYFRLVFPLLNLSQMIKLIEIFSKDQFILLYDINLFFLELYPHIIKKIYYKFNCKDILLTDENEIYEVLLHFDKFGIYNFNNNLSNQNDKNDQIFIPLSKNIKFLIDIKNYLKECNKKKKFNDNNNLIFICYLETLIYTLIKSNNNGNLEYIEYYKLILFQNIKEVFSSEKKVFLNKEEKNFEILNNYLQNKFYEKNGNNDYTNWDNSMRFDNYLYLLNLDNLDDLIIYFLNLRETKFGVDEILFSNIKSNNSRKICYYEDYYFLQTNKILAKLYLFTLSELIGFNNEILKNRIMKLNNFEIFNYLDSLN